MAEQTIMQEHRCTACGEQLHFDPQLQTLICRGCKTEATAEPREDAEATVGTAELTCPNCGAELPAMTGVARQVICGFCDSSFAVLQDGEDCPLLSEVPDDHKYIIPFTTSKEAYQKSMIAWLAGEKGTPVDAFDEVAMIRGAEGYYIPHYICVASYQVNWSASIGYDRIETYIVHVTTTVNGKTTTQPVTKTRIVTDWFPHSSTAAGRVTNECPATNFLGTVHAKIDAANTKESLLGIKDSSAGRFRQTTVAVSPTSARPHGGVPYEAKYTAGFQVLPCELPATTAYDKNFIHEQIAKAIKRDAPGDHIRDLKFHGDILPTYALAYMPTWVSVYSYRNKICASHADGTRVETHHGTRPIDKDQKRKAKRAILPFKITGTIALILLMILGFSMLLGITIQADLFYYITVVAAGLAILTGIVGGIIRSILFGKSKRSLMQQLDVQLENPSKLFGRKSAKADPIREIIK